MNIFKSLKYYLIATIGCIILNSCNSINSNKNISTTPNVIIFIADDISWDDFGCYGNNQVMTPNIDYLAENGVIFNNTYLTTSSCSPSRNSIITGRYPHNTGAAELHTSPPIDMISFPEILKNNGYYTLQAGKFHMGDYAKRGFSEVHDNKKINGLGGENYWEKAIINRPKEKPFFMWLASYDAHRTWGENKFVNTHNPDEINVPDYLVDKPMTRKDLADYYDEITRFDFHVGKVVDKLKEQNIYQNTLIIVMSDNGRPFPHSKTRLNDQGVKTPFIIHYPNIHELKGKESNSLISSIDIAPTIIDLANLEAIKSFQGSSFKNILLDPKKKFRNYVFAEHNWHDYEAHQRMVRNDSFLYIVNSRTKFALTGPLDAINSPTFLDLKYALQNDQINKKQSEIFIKPRPSEELYCLHNDPYQFNNLMNSTKVPKVHELLKQKLNEWVSATGDNIPNNLTKDWYLKKQEPYNQSSLLKTKDFEIRGEMPGKALNAVKNNNKGPF